MAIPSAATLAVNEIKVIDLDGLQSAGAAKRRDLVRRISDSCRGLGFFSIVNHGIPQASIDAVFAAGQRFFALPLERKMEISLTRSMAFRGYLPMKIMGKDQEIKGNLHEAFHCYREVPADDPDVLAGTPLHDVNHWPDLPGFRETLIDYYARVDALSLELLRLFAIGLDLPDDAFTRLCKRPMSALKIMHYPAQDPADPGEQLGVRPHTDPGTVTILAQDNVGGLEVLSPDGTWLAVPPIRGAYVVNIGEMLKIWTDGMFAATPHRVINRYGRDRYSLPFVANPDYDALIVPQMTNPDPAPRGEPWLATSESLTSQKTSGAILERLYGRIWPTAQTQRFDA